MHTNGIQSPVRLENEFSMVLRLQQLFVFFSSVSVILYSLSLGIIIWGVWLQGALCDHQLLLLCLRLSTDCHHKTSLYNCSLNSICFALMFKIHLYHGLFVNVTMYTCNFHPYCFQQLLGVNRRLLNQHLHVACMKSWCVHLWHLTGTLYIPFGQAQGVGRWATQITSLTSSNGHSLQKSPGLLSFQHHCPCIFMASCKWEGVPVAPGT